MKTVISYNDSSKFNTHIDATTDIKGTTQIPTFNTDGTIQKIEHVDASSVVVRLDEFVYTANTITETRKINGILAITYVHNLVTMQSEVQ